MHDNPKRLQNKVRTSGGQNVQMWEKIMINTNQLNGLEIN